MSKNLRKAVITQFFPENDQAYVLCLDYDKVVDQTDPKHPKHDPIWSQKLFNAIKMAMRDSDKIAAIEPDVQDYAFTCEAKLPFGVSTRAITLYLET